MYIDRLLVVAFKQQFGFLKSNDPHYIILVLVLLFFIIIGY